VRWQVEAVLLMPSIFVSIIGQDEDFLKQTIISAIENCSAKNELHFGVVDQRQRGDFSELNTLPNVKFSQLITPPRGVGLPRSESMKFYRGQDYILVIDAHSTFNAKWDEQLIRRLNYIERVERVRAVLSQHLTPAVIKNDRLEEYHQEDSGSTSLYFDGLVIRDNPIGSSDYVYQYPITCQFMFGKAQPFIDVPFDPRIYYLAEESTISLRLWARGYRSFAINYNPMTHLVKPLSDIKNDWRDAVDSARMCRDFEILVEILEEKLPGKWSATPTQIDEFLKVSGLDLSSTFKNLGVEYLENRNEYVKNKMIEVLINNNFNESVFGIIGQIVSKSNTKQ